MKRGLLAAMAVVICIGLCGAALVEWPMIIYQDTGEGARDVSITLTDPATIREVIVHRQGTLPIYSVPSLYFDATAGANYDYTYTMPTTELTYRANDFIWKPDVSFGPGTLHVRVPNFNTAGVPVATGNTASITTILSFYK